MSVNGFYNLTPIYPPSFVGRNLSFVTGFTHRTNITYLELLMELYKWLRDTHIPEIDKILEDFSNKYKEDFENLENNIESIKNDWQKIFNDFMVDVVNQIKILNDEAVSQLILDKESKTYNSIRNHGNKVNIKLFGAIGDGVAYEDEAFQKAADYSALTGSAIYVPAGSYRINKWVELLPRIHDNVWFDGDGESVDIFKDETQFGYIVFLALSKNYVGKGAGVKNFRLSNLKFSGRLAKGASCSALTGHRMSGLLIENCKFEQMSQNGHVLDLMGCDDVTIRKNTFAGCKPPAGREYTEAIQADCSARTGVGFTVDLAEQEVFDGTPCTNIIVENNKFIPFIQDGVTYYAQPPFGTHTYVDGMPHKELHFRNNYVEDVVSTDGNSFSGILHFIGAQGIHIKNNEFHGIKQRANGLFRAIGGANAILFADVNTPSVGLKPATYPINAKDVYIEDNRVVGFNGVAHLIWAYGVSGNRVENINVNRNKFKNCHNGTAMVLVRITITDGLTVKHNELENVGSFVFYGYCNSVTVESNDGTCVADYAIDNDYSDSLSVKLNNFRGMQKGVRFTGGSHIKFHSNNIEAVGHSHGVQIVGTTSNKSALSIIGNTIKNTNESTEPRTGIYCNSTTYLSGIMALNVVENYTGATFSAESVEKVSNILA